MEENTLKSWIMCKLQFRNINFNIIIYIIFVSVITSIIIFFI